MLKLLLRNKFMIGIQILLCVLIDSFENKGSTNFNVHWLFQLMISCSVLLIFRLN